MIFRFDIGYVAEVSAAIKPLCVFEGWQVVEPLYFYSAVSLIDFEAQHVVAPIMVDVRSVVSDFIELGAVGFDFRVSHAAL